MRVLESQLSVELFVIFQLENLLILIFIKLLLQLGYELLLSVMQDIGGSPTVIRTKRFTYELGI